MDNLKARMRGGESLHLEFKSTAPSPWKLARELAAFANSSGGQVLIGVDDGGNICGVKDIEFEKERVSIALEYIDEDLDIKVSDLRHELKDVVAVEVAKLEYPQICYVENEKEETAYFRIGNESRPIHNDAIRHAVRLRRHAKGRRDVSTEGKKLINFLQKKGEKSERVCARLFNYSPQRLRKLAEQLIGGGYLLACGLGTGRSYVAIDKAPR